MHFYSHFEGVCAALVTPYHADLSIDWVRFEHYVHFLCQSGIKGIIPCGTTGEFLALSFQEQGELISSCVKIAQSYKDKAPWVVAGTSAVDVKSTLNLIHQAHACGAQGVLVVSPYYVKPSQSDVKDYYRQIARNSPLPMILYNNPGRTGTEIDPATIIELMEQFPEKVLALKDASKDLSRVACLRHKMPPKCGLLSGEDSTFIPYLAAGGHGLISVAANVVPSLFLELSALWQKGQTYQAQQIADRLTPLMMALNQGTNPIAIKYALQKRGLCALHTRLPLTLSQNAKDAIDLALDGLN